MSSLNLYAKIEDLLDFYDEYDTLHESYLDKIISYGKNSVLDVGCGSGGMLKKLQERQISYLGIDLSKTMIDMCKKDGLQAKCIDIKNLQEKFDIIVCIGDVLNYLNESALKDFLFHIQRCLNDGGLFLCDINTIYAFSEVTNGTYVKDDGERFAALESDFEDGVLSTFITYFEKHKDCYKKEQGSIIQYFYSVEDICANVDLKLENIEEIALFTDECEKLILTFRKI